MALYTFIHSLEAFFMMQSMTHAAVAQYSLPSLKETQLAKQGFVVFCFISWTFSAVLILTSQRNSQGDTLGEWGTGTTWEIFTYVKQMSSIEVFKIVLFNFNMCSASVCSDKSQACISRFAYTEAHYHENYVFVGSFSLFSKIAS